ncbi:MAG: BON domain-containing protein [Acidimicrobiia bacterium]|nr:BON domain-containing protein [Acidimicrobiia bacterium]
MPDDNRDNDKLIPEWNASANDQIGWLGVGVGIILAALLLFGSRCSNVLDRGDDESSTRSGGSQTSSEVAADLRDDLDNVGLTGLDVSVDGTTARLRGAVPSEQYQRVADEIAFGQRDIDGVKDDLSIDPEVDMTLDVAALSKLNLDDDADLASVPGLGLNRSDSADATAADDKASDGADADNGDDSEDPGTEGVDLEALRNDLADAGLADVTAKLSGTSVTLSGSVPSADDRDQAEQIALDTDGVTDVKNDVTIEATKTGEDAIAVERTILSALDDAGLDTVGVSVSGDTATLTGEVATVEDKDDAEDLALAHPAIGSVDNKLTVPDAVGQDAAKEVIDDLDLDVDVLIKGSTATLTGVVPTAADSEKVEGIAAAFEGIDTVDNQLVTLFSEVETTLSSNGFDDVSFELDDYDVTLDGSVNSENNLERLDTAMADVVGIGEVTNDVTVTTNPLEESLRELFADSPVEFASGSATLPAAAQAQLDEAATIINDAPGVDIEVAGYTDNVGNDELNKILSEGRARAVVKYLVDQGVDAERIYAIGYGEARPIAPNDTEAGRAKIAGSSSRSAADTAPRSPRCRTVDPL